jgi:hypothetical protein
LKLEQPRPFIQHLFMSLGDELVGTRSCASAAEGDRKADSQIFPRARWTKWLVWLAPIWVAAGVVCMYWPSLSGSFIWDDDFWVAIPMAKFSSLAGLGRMLLTPTTQLRQYDPLTATSFWLDYNMWGLWTTPYHVENLILHLSAAFFLWRLLRKFNLPGAGIAATLSLFTRLTSSQLHGSLSGKTCFPYRCFWRLSGVTRGSGTSGPGLIPVRLYGLVIRRHCCCSSRLFWPRQLFLLCRLWFCLSFGGDADA